MSCFVVLTGVLLLTPWRDVRADNGRDFTGSFAATLIGPPGSATSHVQLTLRLQNVSGVALTNGVIEVDGEPPGPRAQSFPKVVSLANRALTTVSADVVVATRDAIRWQSGREPAPRIVIVSRDATGNVNRHSVELISAMIGGRP